jgi:hypothetical protein
VTESALGRRLLSLDADGEAPGKRRVRAVGNVRFESRAVIGAVAQSERSGCPLSANSGHKPQAWKHARGVAETGKSVSLQWQIGDVQGMVE